MDQSYMYMYGTENLNYSVQVGNTIQIGTWSAGFSGGRKTT